MAQWDYVLDWNKLKAPIKDLEKKEMEAQNDLKLSSMWG